MGDEQQDGIWERSKELRSGGLDSQAAYRQARSEHDEQGGRIESPPDLDLDDGAADGRVCASIESIEWVAGQLRKKQPDLDSCPSETSLALFQWATSSSVARAEFWKSLWSRTLPTRGEIENQARYRDDGSTLIELAMRIQARLRQERVNAEVAAELRRKQYEQQRAGAD